MLRDFTRCFLTAALLTALTALAHAQSIPLRASYAEPQNWRVWLAHRGVQEVTSASPLNVRYQTLLDGAQIAVVTNAGNHPLYYYGDRYRENGINLPVCIVEAQQDGRWFVPRTCHAFFDDKEFCLLPGQSRILLLAGNPNASTGYPERRCWLLLSNCPEPVRLERQPQSYLCTSSDLPLASPSYPSLFTLATTPVVLRQYLLRLTPPPRTDRDLVPFPDDSLYARNKPETSNALTLSPLLP